MTYLLLQLGLLLGLLAARALDEARRHALGRRGQPALRPGGALAAVLAAVVPVLGHALLGRPFVGAYLAGAALAVLALVPAPFPLLGVPWLWLLGPLWLAAALDAAASARRPWH